MSKGETRRIFTLWDAVLLLSVIVLSVGVLFLLPKKEGKIADVYVENKLIVSLPLNVDREYEVSTAHGYNLICVKNGKVEMKEANCPDKICVQTGKVSRAGSTVYCLPHDVKIVIRGERVGVDG